jgi:hypothetical protein
MTVLFPTLIFAAAAGIAHFPATTLRRRTLRQPV